MPGPSATGDLVLAPMRGLPGGLVIPAGELVERFSRSSGPGGQSVNTADSRVELRFDVVASGVLSDQQRARVTATWGARLIDGQFVIVASEHRSQLRNRAAARARLVNLLSTALAPPAPARRPTRPTRGSVQRRVQAKKVRAQVKQGRGPVRSDRYE